MNSHSTQTFSWKLAVLFSIGAGLLALVLSISLQARSETVQGYLASALQNVEDRVSRGQGASYQTPGKPSQLIIPAIGVSAHIQSVGLAWQGTGDMGIPTNFTDVGWYDEGPVPGAPGSAVIDGHLDGRNIREGVFYNLDKLKIGDLVEVIDTGGKTLKFKVVDTKIYDYDAPTTDIFSGDVSKARLNLITCAGSWVKSSQLYNKRIVVFTELVDSH